jgi:hypothetical protein
MSSRRRTAEYERLAALVAGLVGEHPVLAHAVEDLHHAAPFVLKALQAMQDARPGQPGAQSYNGTRGGGMTEIVFDEDDQEYVTVSFTQTEAAAASGDPTAHDRRTFDRCLESVARECRALSLPTLILDKRKADEDTAKRCRSINHSARTMRAIVDVWKPRHATAKQKKGAVEAANDPDLWCAHHRQAGYMEPTHRVGTVGGNLNVKTPLCSACYDQVRRNGRLPTAEWMQRRARTGKNQKVKA